MSNFNFNSTDLLMSRHGAQAVLDNLKYSEGFSGKDIEKQAEFGTYVQTGSEKDLNVNSEEVQHRLHTNAALPLGAGNEMDKVILEAVTFKPTLYQDLMAYGCRANFSLGTYIARYARSNLPMAPTVSMDALYQAKYSGTAQSQSDFEDIYTPIPMFWYDFALTRRQLAAASNQSSMFGGLSLDTIEIRNKTIGMRDAQEATLWNGNTNIRFNGTSLTGVLTDPTVVANKQAITFSASSPLAFLDQFQAKAIQPLLDEGYDAQNFMVYCSLNLEGRLLNQDYSPSNPTRTIRQRLLEVTPGIMGIKSSRYVLDSAFQIDGNGNPAPGSSTLGTIVVIKMDPQVIDVAVESDIMVAQYAATPMEVRYAMMAACAPRIKKDYYDKVGIQMLDVTLTA